MGGYMSATRAGIGREDILEVSRKIQPSESGAQAEAIDSAHIGSRFNEWRKPVTEYGRNAPEWEVKLKGSPYIGEIDFGRRAWARARDAVDAILKLVLIEVKANAEAYEGLKIERYVRMGSSRDGLKVIAADEFDALLQFHIEGLNYDTVLLRTNGKVIPEFCSLEVSKSMSYLEKRYPSLYKHGVFEEVNGVVKLNARQLHQGVFESLVDKAVEKIRQNVRDEVQRSGKPANFDIKRRVSPPTINITICLDDETNSSFMVMGKIRNASEDVREIDVDIVPGLLLRNDKVPDPDNQGRSMDCPVYAVFKWSEAASVRASIFPNPNVVWRISTSAYERHTVDVARCDRRQRYILTALRVMKTYFSKAKAAGSPPPQITTFFRSYDLKHITLYLILFLCYLHKEASINGIQDVLQYFIHFMRLSLEKKRLPHFFHSNRLINTIYPNYPREQGQLRFNLLRGKSDEAYNQAIMSLENHLVPGICFGEGGGGSDEMFSIIGKKYERELVHGEFF